MRIEKFKLSDIAEIKRAKNGETYQARTSYIELSATKGKIGKITKPGPIPSRNAVIIPSIEVDPDYFNIALIRALPDFIQRYLTTINLQVDVVGNMQVEIPESLEWQKIIVKTAELFELWAESEEKTIESWKEIKKTMLALMFPR